MAKFTRTHRVTPWGGTTEDIGRAAREAQRLVAEATGEELRLMLNVKRPGREDEYDSPAEFEQDVGGDLPSISTIYIRVAPAGYPEKVSVVVIFYKGRAGAWLTVEGTSEVAVTGTALAMQAVLDEGRRRVRWLLWTGPTLVLCGAILTALTVSGVGEHGKHGPDGLNDILAIAGLTADVLVLLGGLVWWLTVPPMELRRAGEPTRLQRLVGRPSRWLLGVVVVAAITAAIGVVLTKIV